MTRKELLALRTGDVVRGKMGSGSWVVMGNYGNRVTAAQTVDITNPGEWDLVLKASHKRPEARCCCERCGWEGDEPNKTGAFIFCPECDYALPEIFRCGNCGSAYRPASTVLPDFCYLCANQYRTIYGIDRLSTSRRAGR